jgi:hypothetical protein
MSVLQGLLGERVNVSIGGEREGSPAALMQVTGVLDSGSDEEVARENGVEDVVMFHLVDQPHSGFFADEECFSSGDVSHGTLRLHFGDVVLRVWPADEDPLTADDA